MLAVLARTLPLPPVQQGRKRGQAPTWLLCYTVPSRTVSLGLGSWRKDTHGEKQDGGVTEGQEELNRGFRPQLGALGLRSRICSGLDAFGQHGGGRACVSWYKLVTGGQMVMEKLSDCSLGDRGGPRSRGRNKTRLRA